ncbi:MAG: L,D-transpeptidase family protein [Deltaproteobacteria bacterium]|nr:L,D-transpeptidase family protein [Deltaproteobacteria bacterium]
MKTSLRNPITVPIFIALLIFLLVSFKGSGVGEESGSLCREIERRLVTADGSPPVIQGKRLQTDPEVLRCFYAWRLYQPLWAGGGRLLPQVSELLATLNRAAEEGLRPEEYQRVSEGFWQSIDAFRQEGTEVPEELLADLELLLTDAFVSYGHDLSYGRVNTEWGCDADCLIQRQECLLGSLEEAFDGGGFAEWLRDLAPRDPAYGKLKERLARHRRIAEQGGWPTVAPDGNLKRGRRHAVVQTLRERLRLSGDLAGETLGNDGMLFDRAVAAGLRRFQKRHGLKPRGALNSETLQHLNLPVEDEIRLIQLNLERLRWLPRDMGPVRVMINIPDYSLALIEGQRSVLSMKVIIGRPLWNTPSFSAQMKYLETNPVWRIPPSIVKEEIVPAILRDPDYITRKNLKFFVGRRNGPQEVSPDKIDWTKIQPESFPYQIIQAAGPANPMGRVKFMFPNEENVYLHDTPSTSLFKRQKRIFSHGCIRIEKPIDLAAYILERDGQWSREKLMAEINKGKTRKIILREPVNVHIVYFTAWVDDDGVLQTRPDVYRSDWILDLALRERESLLFDPPFD